MTKELIFIIKRTEWKEQDLINVRILSFKYNSNESQYFVHS